MSKVTLQKDESRSYFHPQERHPSWRKEINTVCFILCLCVCWRKTVFETSSSALWELRLCYPDNGVLTHLKKTLFFPPLSNTFIFPSPTVSVSPPSSSLILHLYISAFLLLPPNPTLWLVFISFLFWFHFIVNSLRLWYLRSAEWWRGRCKWGEKNREYTQQRRRIGDRGHWQKGGEGVVRGLLQ